MGASEKMPAALAFLCAKKPRSINAGTSDQYKGALQKAFTRYCKNSAFSSPIYSRIYYFNRVSHRIDVDNFSKPILDALKGFAYADDAVVEFRQSGVIDLQREDISSFDLSGMPEAVLEDFIQSIQNEDHLIYVEMGHLDKCMFAFGNSEATNGN